MIANKLTTDTRNNVIDLHPFEHNTGPTGRVTVTNAKRVGPFCSLDTAAEVAVRKSTVVGHTGRSAGSRQDRSWASPGRSAGETPVTSEVKSRAASIVPPGGFTPEEHFYPRALNAHMHPVMADFLGLPLARLTQRFCQINPGVDKDALLEVLSYKPRHFFWAGSDLFLVTNSNGGREMVVIETNSSPSGQKSMPRLGRFDDYGGYRTLIESIFTPLKRARNLPAGGLAVLYDKNYMEATGYAAAMADFTGEHVFLTPFFNDDPNPPARFRDGILEVRHGETWLPMRAALRYVTQQPWARIPLNTRSLIFNPVVACLAGGRNKATAAIAYENMNRSLTGSGLAIHMPETIRDVTRADVPGLVRGFGGMAVVKAPYGNAGQDIFTITNDAELRAFMGAGCRYDRFIVQRMIGNLCWHHDRPRDLFGHVGTVPDQANRSYVADLRFMIGTGPSGYVPVACYSRRARVPLSDVAPSGDDSWSMLGTNLSVKLGENQWKSEDHRLMLMDYKDFQTLGLGLDDLIKSFVQTVLATVAIDRMACSFVGADERIDIARLGDVLRDDLLLAEVERGNLLAGGLA